MIKTICTLFFVWISVLSINAQMNENVVILDMQSKDSETQMIDYYGKLIMTFAPGERPKIEDNRRIKFLTFSLETTFTLYDFSEGYLPVNKDKTWKFYNHQGKVVKDFGDTYFSFTCPVGGIYRAYQRVDGSRSDFKVVFMDQNFEEMFSGQRFHKATNIQDGFAFVQLDKNGPWSILDAKSGATTNIETELSSKIRDIEKNDDGQGRIQYKGSSKKDIIDKNGLLVDPSKTKKTLTKEEQLIKENVQICINNHSFALSTGIGINEKKIDKRSENKELVYGIIFNHDFIPTWMNLSKQEFFFCDVASEKYIGGLVLDTLNKSNTFQYYDFIEQKKVLTTDKKIEYIYGDRFFITITPPKAYGSKLSQILDSEGNIIFSVK